MKIWRVLLGLAMALTLIAGVSSTSPVEATPSAPQVTEVSAAIASTPAGYWYLPQYTWFRVQVNPYCYIDYLHGVYGNNSFIQARVGSIAVQANGNGGCLGSSGIRIKTWGWTSDWCTWADELWYPPGLPYCTFSNGTLQVTDFGNTGLLAGDLRYMANVLPFTAYYISFSPIR